MKISNCCGASPKNELDEECGICSECGEHCEYEGCNCELSIPKGDKYMSLKAAVKIIEDLKKNSPKDEVSYEELRRILFAFVIYPDKLESVKDNKPRKPEMINIRRDIAERWFNASKNDYIVDEILVAEINRALYA